jgi:hypothetical protein
MNEDSFLEWILVLFSQGLGNMKNCISSGETPNYSKLLKKQFELHILKSLMAVILASSLLSQTNNLKQGQRIENTFVHFSDFIFWNKNYI